VIFHKLFNVQAPEVEVMLDETERFREHLALQDCPSCTEKNLILVSYVQGPKTWGAKFFCGSCQTKGELNSEGFHIELAKKPEEKQDEPAEEKKRETK
jgi:hypothetical protein